MTVWFRLLFSVGCFATGVVSL